jgi:hypothetical protein
MGCKLAWNHVFTAPREIFGCNIFCAAFLSEGSFKVSGVSFRNRSVLLVPVPGCDGLCELSSHSVSVQQLFRV